jgi:hypothetical protein
MQIELNVTQADYLRCVLGEALEHNRDHIDWLQSEEASDEEDKPLQVAECERSIDLASTLLGLLDGDRGERFSWPLRTLGVGADFLVPPHIDERPSDNTPATAAVHWGGNSP